MTLNEHKKELLSAYEDAQKIAFAPFIFQATAAAKETGLLDALGQSDTGLNIEELAKKKRSYPLRSQNFDRYSAYSQSYKKRKSKVQLKFSWSMLNL